MMSTSRMKASNRTGSLPPKTKPSAIFAQPPDQDCSTKIALEEVSTREQIGTGAHSAVYKGSWRGIIVALKKTRLKSGNKQLPHQERNILSRLTDIHTPYCVKLHGYIITSFEYILLLDYMPRGSVAALINEKKFPSDLKIVVNIMKNVTSCVAFMHADNIVHCDIKPHNILLNDEYEAKLCDFELAKKIDGNVRWAGTIEYLAPEVSDQPYTTKADVYSLGFTFWEMVAACNPYADLKEEEIYSLVKQGRREKIPAHCPPSIAKLITQCWAQQPVDRLSANQLLEGLNDNNILQAEVVGPDSQGPKP